MQTDRPGCLGPPEADADSRFGVITGGTLVVVCFQVPVLRAKPKRYPWGQNDVRFHHAIERS